MYRKKFAIAEQIHENHIRQKKSDKSDLYKFKVRDKVCEINE